MIIRIGYSSWSRGRERTSKERGMTENLRDLNDEMIVGKRYKRVGFKDGSGGH